MSRTFATALLLHSAFLCSHASRTEDTKEVEISSGSRFIENRAANLTQATRHAVMTDVREHQQHRQRRQKQHSASAIEMTPEVRKQLIAFSRSARQAMVDGRSTLRNNEEKHVSMQDALSKAAGIVTRLAEHRNVTHSSELEAALQFKVNGLRKLSTSLVQQGDADLSHPTGPTPADHYMRKHFADFGKLASKSIRDSHSPRVSDQDKAANLNGALSKFALFMSSLSIDSKRHPKLADSLANLRQVTASSLIEQQSATSLQRSEDANQSQISPDMREHIRAFSTAAMQALRDARNPDTDPEQQAKKVQGALAQAADIMTKIAHTHADMSKSPELAEKLAKLQEVTAQRA